jgi:hypothetical protein
MIVSEETAKKLKESNKGFEISTFKGKGGKDRFSATLKGPDGKNLGPKAMKPLVDEIVGKN